MPEFTLNRDYSLRTKAGHIITFKKGVPTYVPPMVAKEALEIGAEALEDGYSLVPPETAPQVVHSLEDKEKLIFMAFEKIISRNKREEFTSQGSPTKAAIETIVGFEVTSKDRMDLWQKYKEAQQAAR